MVDVATGDPPLDAEAGGERERAPDREQRDHRHGHRRGGEPEQDDGGGAQAEEEHPL
ncbi:hypothetical protein ACFQFH_18160 [Halobaculum halobium]|uniref:hypothetical protein n=1 Tax=Halobaculum halobium TaxID=3032281 RepID=UPI00360E3D9C